MLFAELSNPNTVTVTYDRPLQDPAGGDFSAFRVRDGFNVRTVVGATLSPGNVVDFDLGPPGFGTVQSDVSYNPPPNSIFSTGGAPAATQLNFPLE